MDRGSWRNREEGRREETDWGRRAKGEDNMDWRRGDSRQSDAWSRRGPPRDS